MHTDSTSISKETFVPLKPISRLSQNDETPRYNYNDEPVEVIVVFDEGNSRIAIVENSQGEQFDVPMNELEKV